MQLSSLKVAFLIYIIFWIFYVAVHLLDFMFVYGIAVFIYEVIIGSLILAFHYIFNILRYSIPYILIYFLFYIFNVQYQGYYKFNFFGMDLQKHKEKISYLNFYLKEYNYAILLVLNLLFLLIILYFEIYRDILMIGIVLGFYVFLGINIYIKNLLVKKGYFNKVSFNIFINALLIGTISLYIDEIGDTISQYVDCDKINISEYLYSLLKKKDKFFFRLKNDNIDTNYNWWRLQNLFKNQKASLQYIFIKNQIINKGILKDISTSNKYLLYTKQNNITKLLNKMNNDFKINNDKEKNLFDLNEKQNNIYTDKNAVHYEYNKFNNQYKLLKNIRYAKYMENKNFKTYLLNMYGYTSAKFMPKNLYFKKSMTLAKLLKQDVNSKKLTNTLKKVLLNETAALKYNNSILSQYENKTSDLLIKENETEKKSFIFKVKNLWSNFKLNYPSIDMQLYEFNNFKNWLKFNFKYFFNMYGYKYLYFLEYWEKKNYIMYNFFKDYNIKKYNTLNRYLFKDKNYLIKLLKKGESNDVSVIKNKKIIHDKKFKMKYVNSIDRNLLYADHYKTALSKNLKLLILEDKKNEKYFYIKKIHKKFLLFKNPQIWKNKLESNNTNILKKIYLMLSPKESSYYTYGIKNYHKTLVIFHELKNNNLTYIYKNKIDSISLNIRYYAEYIRISVVYNNLLTKYLHLKWIDYVNMKDNDYIKFKKMLSVLYDISYNNKVSYESFKQWYNHKGWVNGLKIYIFNLANNMNNESFKYYKQYLLETKDLIAEIYNEANKKKLNYLTMHEYNEWLNQSKKFYYNYYKWQKWFIRTFKFQKNPDMFSDIKNPYLDRSVYWKEYLKAMDWTRYIKSFSCPEERIVAEKLDMVLNRQIIAELAYDTRTAMLNDDLDYYIENQLKKEAWYLNKRMNPLKEKVELESCGRSAEYMQEHLSKCYVDYDYDIAEADMIYNHLREYNKACLIELHKYLEDLAQVKRLFGDLTWEELEEIGLTEDPEVVEDIEFVKKYDELWPFSDDLKLQYQYNSILLGIDLYESRIQAMSTCNAIVDDVLQVCEEQREADFMKIKPILEEEVRKHLIDMEHKYSSLRDFSARQKIFKNELLKYQQENTPEKRINRYVLNNDWDAYNKKRAKMDMDINFFKNLKKK